MAQTRFLQRVCTEAPHKCAVIFYRASFASETRKHGFAVRCKFALPPELADLIVRGRNKLLTRTKEVFRNFEKSQNASLQEKL